MKLISGVSDLVLLRETKRCFGEGNSPYSLDIKVSVIAAPGTERSDLVAVEGLHWGVMI